jgi:hypothetical protein
MMPFYHGIVAFVSGWMRILSGIDSTPPGTEVKKLDGGAYVPAFLQHFFPGRYRVEVRSISDDDFEGHTSDPPVVGPLKRGEALRFSTASDQYSVRIKDCNDWLEAFAVIGLLVGNSKKMTKRLVELVRLASAWLHLPNGDLKVEVIDHSYPECYVDGISAISQSLAVRCIKSNDHASSKWRRREIRKIKSGETACVIFRMLTPDGLIKGNALVLPDRMMNGMDVRTFAPNIKGEIRTTGWQWVTIEPTYGAIPVKSDDLTHSIYRGVNGLYDDATLMESLKGMLAAFFDDLKEGKQSAWMEKLANEPDSLHDVAAREKYSPERGLVACIQHAVADLARVGVPLTASQTLMFMGVNGLSRQLLDRSLFSNTGIGEVWRKKSRHWFPVPWAYAAHIYTQEVLSLFGFDMPGGDAGFYHEATHSFVVPGYFFQKNMVNHGGPDLDDTIKVHIRMVAYPDGAIRKMAFILRNPNDFGEWSMIPVEEDGPVFHTYGEIPTVSMEQLVSKVPQFSDLRAKLTIGVLPCIANKATLGTQFSLADEERFRNAVESFPAGVGGTVIPKMIWYAVRQRELRTLVASNEDIIDALQQGQAGTADIELIQEWISNVFAHLGKHTGMQLDAFWFHTRLPGALKKSGWTPAPLQDSTWIRLHREREAVAGRALDQMAGWLNSQIVMPDAMASLNFSENELLQGEQEVRALLGAKRQVAAMNAGESFASIMVAKLNAGDAANGEEAVDRKILRMAVASIRLKKADRRSNYDQWLYQFDPRLDSQPVDWLVRALTRTQDGTYNWHRP